VNFSNISAFDTNRFLTIEAYGEASVKNITLENIRAGASAMSYMESDGQGVIDHIYLHNVEVTASDRYAEYTEETLNARGDHIFKVNRTGRVTMERVKLYGQFEKMKEAFVCSEHVDLYLKDCNFVV